MSEMVVCSGMLEKGGREYVRVVERPCQSFVV